MVYDESVPAINNGVVSTQNDYIDITFSEGVYNTDTGTGALSVSDFTLLFSQNGGDATGVVMTDITKTGGGPLTGGESVIRIHITVTGVSSGDETVEFTPADGSSIFDVVGNAAAVTETTGATSLHKGPFAEGTVIIRNNIINPRRGEVTTVNITVQKREKVTVTVYDLAGDPVKQLYSTTADIGLNEVPWNGKNKRGKNVVQGVYYVVTKIGKKRYVHKVLVVR